MKTMEMKQKIKAETVLWEFVREGLNGLKVNLEMLSLLTAQMDILKWNMMK